MFQLRNDHFIECRFEGVCMYYKKAYSLLCGCVIWYFMDNIHKTAQR